MAWMGWVARHTGMPSLRIPTTAGTWGQVTATSGGRQWVAWRGLGTGADVLVSDPLAPVGQAVTYSLGARSVTLTRATLGGHAVTDRCGRTVAVVRLTGDDQIAHDPGVSALSTSGGVADRWPLMASPVVVSMEALTVGAATAAMRSLLTRRARLVVLHDPSVCEVRGCDIPLVRDVVVSAASESRTGAVMRATRAWSLTLQDRTGLPEVAAPGGPAGGPAVPGAPVVSWGEWQALDGGWAHRTYVELCQLVAGMPS